MALLDETLKGLNTNDISAWYRFQGGKSFEHINIRSVNPFKDCDRYVYFSKGINHHKYFVAKRLKQIVSELGKDKGFVLSRNHLLQDKTYKDMVNIIQSEASELSSMSSIKIIYAKPLEDLVNQNFILNQSKTSNSHLVERVDRRKYGGGYGLPKEWLELLNHLTIMTLDNSLSAYDILDYLHLMRKVSKPFAPKKDVVPFIDDSKFTYSLNEQFLSSFNKYEIVADLERILDLDLVLSDSDLAKYPKETISSIITFYQSLREKVLRKLEIAYKKNYKK